jgi:multidrug resistance efflux pump
MKLRIVFLCAGLAVFGEAIAQDKVATQATSGRLEIATTLEPLRSTTLLNQREGRSRIQSILPEATAVKTGDVVCTIDMAEHRDKVTTMRMEMEHTRAEIAAYKAVSVAAERKANALQASASRRLNVAQMALQSWTKGESPVQQADLEGALRICMAELAYAKGIAAAAEEVESPIEMLRAKLELTKADVNLRSAELRLKHHREFVGPQRVAQLKLEVEQAAMEVDTARADAGDALRTADLAAKTQQLAMQEQLLKKAMKQQQLGQISAPHDGVVFHADPGSRRANSLVLRAGQEVRERQMLVHVHDLSKMRAIIELDAATANQLEPGQRVDVQVDALPNHSFKGKLEDIVKEKDSAKSPPKASILIDPVKGVMLLPGMTAVVTIELDQ